MITFLVFPLSSTPVASYSSAAHTPIPRQKEASRNLSMTTPKDATGNNPAQEPWIGREEENRTTQTHPLYAPVGDWGTRPRTMTYIKRDLNASQRMLEDKEHKGKIQFGEDRPREVQCHMCEGSRRADMEPSESVTEPGERCRTVNRGYPRRPPTSPMILMDQTLQKFIETRRSSD
jgi:hypothetical protein